MPKIAFISALLALAAATACGSEPETAEEHLMQGMLLSTGGDVDAALARYDAALRLKPDDASIYVTRAITHDMNGSYERALADYEKAIALQPELEAGLALQLDHLREKAGR